jgi:hypothetical protein
LSRKLPHLPEVQQLTPALAACDYCVFITSCYIVQVEVKLFGTCSWDGRVRVYADVPEAGAVTPLRVCVSKK